MHSLMRSCSSESQPMVDMRVSFIKSPDGSFPDEPDTKLTSDDEVKTSTGNSRRFCIGKESFAYQELRELRLPSVQTVKRNVKTSVQKLRCQGRFRSGSTGIITFDDYTADLYGCDNDDELPLLVGSNADESTN